MAFFGNYTGQRINPLPAGYLAANARSAMALQQGLASAGKAIKEWRDDKEEDKQNEILQTAWEESEKQGKGNKSKGKGKGNKSKGKGKGKAEDKPVAPQIPFEGEVYPADFPYGGEEPPPGGLLAPRALGSEESDVRDMPDIPDVAGQPTREQMIYESLQNGTVQEPRLPFSGVPESGTVTKLPGDEPLPSGKSFQNLFPLPRDRQDTIPLPSGYPSADDEFLPEGPKGPLVPPSSDAGYDYMPGMPSMIPLKSKQWLEANLDRPSWYNSGAGATGGEPPAGPQESLIPPARDLGQVEPPLMDYGNPAPDVQRAYGMDYGIPAPDKPRVQGLDYGIPAPDKPVVTGEDIVSETLGKERNAAKQKRMTVNEQMANWIKTYGKDANAETMMAAYGIFNDAHNRRMKEKELKFSRKLSKQQADRSKSAEDRAEAAELRAAESHKFAMGLLPVKLKGALLDQELTQAQIDKIGAEVKQLNLDDNEIKSFKIKGTNYLAVKLPGAKGFQTLQMAKAIVMPANQAEVNEQNEMLKTLGEEGKPPAQWVKDMTKEGQWKLIFLRSGSDDFLQMFRDYQNLQDEGGDPTPSDNKKKKNDDVTDYRDLEKK